MKRGSGIIMPIFSLPSPYGIGSMGREAYTFADFLHAAGQRFWQLLPLNPTSFGDSPYQSLSVFAGNPYFIDIELLIEDGLLTESEAANCKCLGDPRYVDYEHIYNTRFNLLRIAKERGWKRDFIRVKRFVHENESWLPNYALFMALKRHFDMKAWTEWEDEDARIREPEALKAYRTKLKDDIELFTYIQYLFFNQWKKLKAYVNGLGIQIIGDLPIYVAMDSADVWAEPAQFQINGRYEPSLVAGVPPDYFSEDGQLWGNPLYRWDKMKEDGFDWWLRRVDGARKLYDVIRIDHFRGIESYWAVKFGEDTAKNGRWIKGPGMDFVNAVKNAFPGIEIIAEDLGHLTKEVKNLMKKSGFPGMKVLEFAFGADEQNDYLPHNYDKNCVCYTGTHDNSPLMLWLEEDDSREAAFAKKYFALNKFEGYNWGIIRGGMVSVADVFIAQMQDYLGLGEGHRTNAPGIAEGNWRWRMLEGEALRELAERIRVYTKMYGRI